MFENQIKPDDCILVCVDTEEFNAENSLEELEELAKTAGANVIAKFIQKRPNLEKATCVGTGKLEEILEFSLNNEIDLIIFDHELTATQVRNIEQVVGIRVIDRTTLILDIFASRALSKEGRLQVELAQQKYRLPRLAGIGIELSRLGGGIGTRGPGETKLETDKRHIRTRIKNLTDQLKEIELRKHRHRQKRKKDNILTVAIVGYTNVGKSTLLNKLTDAGVLAQDMLFATLDPTSRSLELPDGRNVMLIDTVGLISRLPHHLVEAFKSTLQEVNNADLIVHMCDISNPHLEKQMEVTNEILNDLGCGDIPVVQIFNKCDKTIQNFDDNKDDKTVFLSAFTGFGIDDLLNSISKNLITTSRRLELVIPYNQTNLINVIREKGKIYSEEFLENGTRIDAEVDNTILHLVENLTN